MGDVPEPKAVLRAMGAARRDNDFEAALRFIAPESLDQGHPVTRDDWRRKWEQMRQGSPDMEVITEHSMEDGEWIARRYTIRGTHMADLFGQRPTGIRFEVRGMDMVRVRDGLVIEHWAFAEPLHPRAATP
jgi:predicted ester cyclase